MEEDINILVDGYEKFTESELKVQKTTGDPIMTLSKIKLKYYTDIYKYRLFMVQIMWYTANVGLDVSRVAI